jgi:hypothetical protein
MVGYPLARLFVCLVPKGKKVIEHKATATHCFGDEDCLFLIGKNAKPKRLFA